MRQFLCWGFMCASLIGCAGKFSVVELPSSRIRSFSQISPDRTTWRLTLANELDQDVYCKRIAVRVIFDNPKDYLETGEVVQLVTDKYLRSKQSIKLSGNVPVGDPGGARHVRSVSMIDPDCTSSSIYHFCTFAEKSATERANLVRLGEVARAENCAELAEKIGRVQQGDLRTDDDPASRPFRFIPQALGQ